MFLKRNYCNSPDKNWQEFELRWWRSNTNNVEIKSTRFVKWLYMEDMEVKNDSKAANLIPRVMLVHSTEIGNLTLNLESADPRFNNDFWTYYLCDLIHVTLSLLRFPHLQNEWTLNKWNNASPSWSHYYFPSYFQTN